MNAWERDRLFRKGRREKVISGKNVPLCNLQTRQQRRQQRVVCERETIRGSSLHFTFYSRKTRFEKNSTFILPHPSASHFTHTYFRRDMGGGDRQFACGAQDKLSLLVLNQSW